MSSQKPIIREYKELREEVGLSYQQIVDRSEAGGESVSLSTVKRVFAQGSESQAFRPDTLNTIGKILFEERERLTARNRSGTAAINALLEMNSHAITSMEEENLRKNKQIQHLTAQLETAENHIRKRDSIVFWLALSLTGLLLLDCVVLIIDVLNTGVGWIREHILQTFTGTGIVALAGTGFILSLVITIYITAKAVKHRMSNESENKE